MSPCVLIVCPYCVSPLCAPVCPCVALQVKQMSSEDTEHKDLFKRNLSHSSLAALAAQQDAAEAEFTVRGARAWPRRRHVRLALMAGLWFVEHVNAVMQHTSVCCAVLCCGSAFGAGA